MSPAEHSIEPYSDLPDWFAFLKEHGFDMSVQRQTTVSRWLLRQASSEVSETANVRWMDNLAPLICRDREEQTRYQDLTRQWHLLDHSKSRGHDQIDDGTKGPPPELPTRRLGWRIVGGLLSAVMLSWALTVFYSAEYCKSVAGTWLCSQLHDQTNPTINPPTSNDQKPIAPPSEVGWTQVAQPLSVQPKIDLSRVNSIEENAERHWLWWCLAFVPPSLLIVIVIWLWRRRSDVLQHAQGDDTDDLQRDALRLAEPGALFDAVDTDTAMRALNQPMASSLVRGELDTAESLRATARSGVPRLVHTVSARLPEIVLLVQISSASDLRKELAERLTVRLQRNGLRTSTYLFSSQPTWLLKLGAHQGERCPPAALRRRHPDARLLVLCEPSRVYDLYASRLLDWASTLATWQSPLAIMTLEPFEASLARQLRQDGLQLLPLDAEGLEGLLESHRSAHNAARLLPLHLYDEDWPSQEEQAQERYQKLSQFMGVRGMRLLEVLALYPELHLGLAAALDRLLFADSDGPSRQRRLYRLLRLPWARHGWLPEPLRLALLAAQTAQRRAEASAHYQQLFESLGANGELRLPFTHPDRWTAWRLFLGLRGPGGRDMLFLSQVVGPRWLNKLAFYLPTPGRWLANLGRHYLALASALFLLSLLPTIWLIANPPIVTNEGPLNVSVVSSDADNAVKSQITQWLSSNGANLLDSTPTTVDKGITLRVTPARHPLARQLAESIRRMATPQQVIVQLDNELVDDMIIEIGEPVEQAIPVFRDHFASNNRANSALSDVVPGLRMVSIPAGTFLMGSTEKEVGRGDNEGPQHEVTVPAFELSETEVSFDQYDTFARETQRGLPDDEGWGRGSRPVINVSWDDAVAFITWLNEKTGENFRLPTEAEWEYAARAGTTTPFYTGDCISTSQANYRGTFDYNDCGANTGEYQARTTDVKTYPPNDWGLYDMLGNVWEWTEDCWHTDYTDAPIDGSAWQEASNGDCDRRVLRGGAWLFTPEVLRAAFRYWNSHVNGGSSVGFRLARTQ